MAIDIAFISDYDALTTYNIFVAQRLFELVAMDNKSVSLTILYKQKYIWIYFYNDTDTIPATWLDPTNCKTFFMVEFLHSFLENASTKSDLSLFYNALKTLGFDLEECE